MFRNATSTFDRLIEKATSQLLLEPDWDSILQICDLIRQGDVPPKHAAASLKKKISHENPHVSMFALQCLESVMKNCGSLIHDEVATKDFMEFLRETVQRRPDPVKAKILELVQVWSHAFRSDPKYKACQDVFNLLKMEGHSFPQLKEADAMFSSEKAPEWIDGECCHRCRFQFTTFQRKHHCRACGQVFCGKCSSKNSIIPKFGIEKEVRVCDSCFDQLNKSDGSKKDDDLPEEYLKSPLSRQSQMPSGTSSQKSEKDLEQQEQEELALALALSQSEAEAKSKERERMKLDYNPYGNSASDTKGPSSASQPMPKVTAASLDTSDMDPDLARYLNRNYWEQKQDELSSSAAAGAKVAQPSAPIAAAPAADGRTKTEEKYQNGDMEADDASEAQFLDALQKSVEIFVNRMKSNSSRGRSIANDSSVQSLFLTINAMHPELMRAIGKQEDARSQYEGLQDKLAQLKDARDALEALREEHRERRLRERQEQERLRAIQMAQKLEVLRQQKQVYLEQQRQLELQRMEELRMEMEMRLQQQKHMQQMRAMHYAYPQMYPQQQPPPPAFSPPGAGSLEGSPHHQPHMPPQGYVPVSGAPPMGVPPGAPGAGMQPMPNMSAPQPTSGYSTAGYPQGLVSQAPMMSYPAHGGYAPPQEPQMYNMQGLATALPPGTIPGGQAPPPQAYGPPPPGPQNQYPGPGMPPDQMQQQQMPPHSQGGPIQHEAQLISFD